MFDIVMPMYNLLERSDISFMTSGSLRNYYRDEVNNDQNENYNANDRINNKKLITSKSFEYEAKIITRTPADNNELNPEIAVPL